MQRLYTEKIPPQGAEITFPAEAAHYLCNVLRLKVHERVLLFNAAQGEWQASLTHVAKGKARAQMEQQTRPPHPDPALTLLFAPIKKAPLEWLLEKATELGATRLQPVITRRTVVQDINSERLQRLVTEAAEQCERLSRPELLPPIGLPALLNAWPPAQILIWCAEAGESQPLHDLLRVHEGPLNILTGPEGGFTEEELKLLQQQPFGRAASLGPLILRAETAGIAALAAAQTIAGSWRAPLPPRPPYGNDAA